VAFGPTRRDANPKSVTARLKIDGQTVFTKTVQVDPARTVWTMARLVGAVDQHGVQGRTTRPQRLTCPDSRMVCAARVSNAFSVPRACRRHVEAFPTTPSCSLASHTGQTRLGI
jgi:hypothetical protein